MNEGQIREALILKLTNSVSGGNATFISEMFIDAFARRADLIVANGRLSAFEIKSERDSLDRLAGQLESYRRLFERVTIVCAERHLAGVEMLAPCGTGIWTINGDGRIRVIRRAKLITQLSVRGWLSFLPVDELRMLFRNQGARTVGCRDDLLAVGAGVPVQIVRQYVLDYLKRRDGRITARVAKRTNQVSAARSAKLKLEHFLSTISTTAVPMVAIPRKRNHSSNSPSRPSPSSSPN